MISNTNEKASWEPSLAWNRHRCGQLNKLVTAAGRGIYYTPRQYLLIGT
jgi:hypothetical protein